MENQSNYIDSQVPSASGESQDLPVKVEADFAPLKEVFTNDLTDKPETDPHHEESLRVQEAFEQATQAAADGDEERAVRQYLKAANLAEATREW